MVKNLNNAKPLENLQSDYFVRMMLPDAEKKVLPYVIEEKANLIKLLKSINKIDNLILWLLDQEHCGISISFMNL
jgi:hypothetical protein